MTNYPTTCPTWCTGQHPAQLTPPSYDAAGADLAEAPDDAAEIVTHFRTLTDPDQPAGPVVILDQDEAHPASLHRFTAEPARLHVWLPDDHDHNGITPAELRAWAAILEHAADAATHHLNGADQ